MNSSWGQGFWHQLKTYFHPHNLFLDDVGVFCKSCFKKIMLIYLPGRQENSSTFLGTCMEWMIQQWGHLLTFRQLVWSPDMRGIFPLVEGQRPQVLYFFSTASALSSNSWYELFPRPSSPVTAGEEAPEDIAVPYFLFCASPLKICLHPIHLPSEWQSAWIRSFGISKI